jgi:glutathione synthase/RimK-type ligase-like ATP-grasp enzyme
MSVEIAIHENAGGFSTRWKEHCEELGLKHRVVNCYDSDIIEQLSGADALLWHWSMSEPTALRMALDVIMAAEAMGILVFPSTPTCWHFDNKVSQKYLLEAVRAPLVGTHVFYDRNQALEWIEAASFPKVFKLSRGAGSVNVRLARTPSEARALTRQAFGKGFKAMGTYFRDVSKRVSTARKGRSVWKKLRRMPQGVAAIRRRNWEVPRERGYVYFQDFMPENTFDTRITVIGDRAFGFTRDVRPNDFRASGSGSISYDLDRVDLRCVEIAFETARKIGSQSMAFDFIFAPGGEPKIVEVSYAYLDTAVHNCEGHWDPELNWCEGRMWPQDAIFDDVVASLEKRARS